MRLANWSSSTRKAFSWTKDLTYVCAFSAAGANFTTVLHEHGCCANASARADALAFCAQNGLDVIIKTDAAGGGPGWDQVNSARFLDEFRVVLASFREVLASNCWSSRRSRALQRSSA